MRQLYHLLTPHNQLSLSCDGLGHKVFLAYFGVRLNNPDDVALDESASWPLYATDFDSTGLFGNYSGEYALNSRLPDRSLALDLCLANIAAEAQQIRLTLRDSRCPDYAVELLLQAQGDIITWDTTIINGTAGELTLLRALTAALPLRAPSYHLTSFRGAWAGENLLEESEIKRGSTQSIGSTTGLKCAEEGSPVFLLALGAPAAEESGSCLLGALAWSGNYTMSFKHSCYGHIFLGLGHDFEHSPYILTAGQRLELPQAIFVFSDRGKGEATRRLHRYLRGCVIPRGTEIRRSLLNSWEGVHFKVDEGTLHSIMNSAAKLGVELFVLDDGWFGQRDDDSSSLGDWEPDPRKLPHGLTGLTEHARSIGIDFGLWMEPEMISPHSKLYAQQPQAAMALPGIPPREERHQLVLDPAFPYERFVEQTLNNAPGISYIKWDCNRKISDPGCASLRDSHPGNLFFDTISAYYKRMDYLRKRFPSVTFQGCCSGGGRVDLGAARFHEEFWLSDNTDPYCRLRIQWSALHFLPPNAMGCHVTASPNLYTGRETDLKFRFDVAMMGRIGLELDPRTLSGEQAAEIRERLALAHELRPLIQRGELHRLVSPYEGPDCALLFAAGKRALLLAYTTERLYTDQHTRYKLHGLNPIARYRLSELLPDKTGKHSLPDGTIIGGDALLSRGLPLRWNRPMQSCVILLEEETPLPQSALE